MGTYIRLVDYNSQQAKEDAFLSGSDRYTADSANFTKIPGSPIAYWVSVNFIKMFENQNLQNIGYSFQGIITGNVNKFLRLWHEINYKDIMVNGTPEKLQYISTFIPYIKGGEFRRWYGNLDYVINWYHDGKNLIRSRTENREYFLIKGITWSLITPGSTSFRYFDEGFLCDVSGSSYFVKNNEFSLYYVLAFLNSKISNLALMVINPTINMNVKDILLMPIIKSKDLRVDDLVQFCVSISKSDWNSFETSWDFIKHPLV